MIDIKKQPSGKRAPLDKQRSYGEVVDFLDKSWAIPAECNSLERVQKIDQALESPSQKLNTMVVAGTNGKSLTIHLTAKLLKEEGLKIGTFYAPHILTYNERIAINNETVSNKVFTEVANEVINAAEQLEIQANTYELLTVMALQYFVQQQVDVVILESHVGGKFNPVNICNTKVASITRVIEPNALTKPEDLKFIIEDMMGVVKTGTWVVSGDQSKAHLQMMNELCNSQGGNWAMPIRKLAAMVYPFEQLHGRCAALAERLAHMYMEYYHNKNATITADSLLSKQKGQRGRPTLEAKRRSELNPKKTLEQFWKEEVNELPGRFQLLDKEKPSILLDTASNIDALKNVLLGTRLLHYQKSLKGLAIIIGAAQNSLYNEEFLKSIRYFFKKTSGQLFICPIESNLPGTGEDVSWNTEQVANDIKSMKIKAKACKNFEEAFDAAKKSVEERNGLVVITGSKSIVNNYWINKGIKKF